MAGTVKAIVPKDCDVKAVMSVLDQEVRKYAPFLVNDYEKPTKAWQGDKPRFVPVFKTGGGRISITIRVLGPELGKNKWHWLDAGTKAHKIPKRVRKGKRLHFRSGKYQAGSRPGSLSTSRPGYPKGPFVSPKQVNHPGNAPRGWTEIIVRENQRAFERWMQAAMQHAARASGHSATK